MDEILAATALTKSYSGVTVVSAVDLPLRGGEVHALIGENGAGKSTLIRMLTGTTAPDSGEIRIRGKAQTLASPAEARRNGIVGIFQELAIVPELSVAENILLGTHRPGPEGHVFSRRDAYRRAREVLAPLVGDQIDARAIAGRLSTAERQVVEIARALAIDAPVIIMDEPTASLSPREVDALLAIIRRLRDAGKAVLFVSHRLNEVTSIADQITVMRGGQRVASISAKGATPAALIELMVGRPVASLYPPRNRAIGEVILSARGLRRGSAFADISFSVRRGEVLGFAGLVGAGRTEIMRTLFGLDPLDAGEIVIDGKPVHFGGPMDAIRAGLGFVSEDRKDDGLVLCLSGRENIVLAAPEKAQSAVVVRRGIIRSVTERLRGALSIRGSLDIAASGLSGGNQQKLVLARWMLAESRILILDEPTRGIDVGAKVEVYRLIHQLAAAGTAVLLVSSEMPELMNVAHRLLVISGGRIAAEMDEAHFDEKEILRAAFTAHLGHAPEQARTNAS